MPPQALHSVVALPPQSGTQGYWLSGQSSVTMIPAHELSVASRLEGTGIWRELIWTIASILLVGTVASLAFSPSISAAFLNYDDPAYITANPLFEGGLVDASTLLGAFTDTSTNLYHPATWLSHAADVALFGTAEATGHRVHGLALHVGVCILTLLLLRSIGLSLGAAVAATLLTAVHPARSEVVCWVSERKELLSSFAILITLLLWQARRLRIGRIRRIPGSLLYGLSLLTLVVALLAKPTAVITPVLMFAMFALRSHPLHRDHMRDLIAPVILAGFVAILTIVVQSTGSHASGMAWNTPTGRVGVAGAALLDYLKLVIVPDPLAPCYPYPETISLLGSVAMLASVIASIIILIFLRKRAPRVLFGAAFFILPLLPVLGFIDLGKIYIAERYLYLPIIGGAVLAAAGIDRLRGRPFLWGSAIAAVVAITGLFFFPVARTQAALWKNSSTLFEHAHAIHPRHWLPPNNLGIVALSEGDLEAAESHFLDSLKLAPESYEPNANLARLMLRHGRYQEAYHFAKQALLARPTSQDMQFLVDRLPQATR